MENNKRAHKEGNRKLRSHANYQISLYPPHENRKIEKKRVRKKDIKTSVEK